jgi:outer membrane receptor protein involved in Fe transport
MPCGPRNGEFMFAAEPPAIAAPAAPADQADVIEIVGTRRDQTLKIDRRTYRVQQTPHSAQKDAVQLLRGLPAVTISPDDSINLLGSGNVSIYVDGRPYQGNATQYLRTLHGSDIERIEIITNPSAQYSAEGTGGIINFVLRRKQEEGVSGTGIGEVSSLGRAYFDATLKTKHGKWSYELHSGGRVGTLGRPTYRKVRSVAELPGGTPTVNTETGGGPNRGKEVEASAKASYEIDPRTSLSGKILAAVFGDVSTNKVEFAGLTPDFESFSQRQRFNTGITVVITELNFDHKGKKEGETLNAGFRIFGNPTDHEENRALFSDSAALAVDKRKRLLFATAQLDWQHPMAKGQILSVGGSWDFGQMSERYRFTSTGSDGSLGSNASDQFRGIDNKLAAYVTFQQTIGGWTVMPGVRVERNSRRISSQGQPDVRIARTDVFPTLHIDHRLGKNLDLTLSYSKRIDRPQLNDLRPYGIVQDVLTIKQGNPRLRNQSTDSYEINLHHHRGKLDAGLIAYDRETRDVWSNSYFVNPAGVTVFTLVNAGCIRDRGAQVDISTPVVKRVKLNATLNLFEERAPIGVTAGAGSEDVFRYTTNSTLEWNGPDRGRIPGDVAQLQWGFNSSSRQVQFRYFPSSFLSLSYTHGFSRTLSLTGSMSRLSRIRHDLVAPLVQEDYAEHRQPEFKLKLLKTFGKP